MTFISEQTKRAKKKNRMFCKLVKFCFDFLHDTPKGNADFIGPPQNARKVYFGAEGIEDELLTYL